MKFLGRLLATENNGVHYTTNLILLEQKEERK